MQELEYPFDSEYILKKSKKIKRQLLEEGAGFLPKRIAVLGGSTTHDIIRVLEVFLLNQGIQPEFYESEYNRFYEDAVFGNEELDSFSPDFVIIHTTNRNIMQFPQMTDSQEQITQKLEEEYEQLVEELEPQFIDVIRESGRAFRKSSIA